MVRSNKSFVRIAVTLWILLFAYLVATVFKSTLWGNLLSPINAFAVSGVLLFTYLKTDHESKIRVTFLFYSLAAFMWGVGDIMCALLPIMGIDTSKRFVVSLAYTISNCLIIVALLIFSYRQFHKWNGIQLGIDILTVGFLFIYFVWIVYLHKDFALLWGIFGNDYTSIFSLLCDIFIVIGITTCLLSVRSGNLPFFIKVLSLGPIMFAIVDMLYYYYVFNNSIVSNSLTDFLYIVSLQVMAFGALWKTYKDPALFSFTELTNRGSKRSWIYMLIFPLSAVALEILGMPRLNVTIWDILLYAFVIFIYGNSCKYVQLSIENERLLAYVIHTNRELEVNAAAQVSKLSFLENQDPLTALYNRRYFMSCIDDAIGCHRDDELLSVLLLDIDRFKTVNDSYGHDVGDKVLIKLSARLTRWNCYCATLARLGGDEFAIVISGKYSDSDIKKFCGEIIEICSLPLNLGFDTLQVTISLGVALYSEDANSSNELMKNAEIAMYRAKSQGYNKYQFYDPFFNRQINKNNEIARLLQKAKIDSDFDLFYQPQFSLPDKKLIGAEALIRWKSAEHGYILPNEFIPIAEEINCISEIGKWVMTEAIRQGSKWNNEYGLQLEIGFNVSVKQLVDDSFAETLENLASKEGFNPNWIGAEITESFMISDKLKVRSVFEMFNRLGISVSIDDFGSGYSSYGYLNELPFDRIKIDKSLVDKASPDNFGANQVLKAIIAMSQAVGVTTIAEGVENQKQLDILTELGCDQVQGFLFGRPVPPDVFERKFILKQ